MGLPDQMKNKLGMIILQKNLRFFTELLKIKPKGKKTLGRKSSKFFSEHQSYRNERGEGGG